MSEMWLQQLKLVIDLFNGMSIRLGLFDIICIRYMFIFTFFVQFLKSLF